MKATRFTLVFFALTVIVFSIFRFVVELAQEGSLRTVTLKNEIHLKLANPHGIMDDRTTSVYPAGMDFTLHKGARLVIEYEVGTNILVSYFGKGPGASAPYGSQFLVGRGTLEWISSTN